MKRLIWSENYRKTKISIANSFGWKGKQKNSPTTLLQEENTQKRKHQSAKLIPHLWSYIYRAYLICQQTWLTLARLNKGHFCVKIKLIYKFLASDQYGNQSTIENLQLWSRTTEITFLNASIQDMIWVSNQCTFLFNWNW